MVDRSRSGARALTAGPARPGVARLEPVAGRRHSRISEIVLGLVVVTVCGLGVVLWHTSSARTTQVLVLARPVRAGATLSAGDVRAADVMLGHGVSAVPVDHAKTVLGKVAAADLGVGTMVTPALFSTRPSLPPGSTVVAAALVPGQFASFALRPGSIVDAIRAGDADTPGQIVASHATVFEVQELKDSAGTWIVSLVVPEQLSASVASAATAKRLTLALVGGAP
jgi:hypothetical protein